jgi:hypothetical protein
MILKPGATVKYNRIGHIENIQWVNKIVNLYWMVDFACCGHDNFMFVPCIAGLCIENRHYFIHPLYILDMTDPVLLCYLPIVSFWL